MNMTLTEKSNTEAKRPQVPCNISDPRKKMVVTFRLQKIKTSFDTLIVTLIILLFARNLRTYNKVP